MARAQGAIDGISPLWHHFRKANTMFVHLTMETLRMALDLDADVQPPFGRSVLAWPPFIWSQVLFAGADPRPEPLRWRSLLWLLLLPALLLYVRISFPLFEPDEGRYAEIPREMLARGEWVTPYLEGKPYLDKPPLFYWLVMGSYRIFGIHDWSARLVPAVAIHLTLLLVYFFGRRRIGDAAAFRGALLLALAPAFVSIGRLLVIDGLLSLCVAFALFAAWEALERNRGATWWWLFAGMATGLGILTKGPIAVILLLPPLALAQWLRGRNIRLRSLNTLAFVGATIAVALPWYIAICLRLPGFAVYFLWQHNVLRFFAPFDHLEPFWYYTPILALGLLPGTLLLVGCARFLISGEAATAARRGPGLGFLLLAGGWCVLFFSVSGCKLPTYILPAFPFLALALGYFWAVGPWRERRWMWNTVAVAFGVICLGHNAVLPWYARYRGTVTQFPEVLAYCSDRRLPLLCYPRPCDSVAFYAQREDLTCYRSKETNQMILSMQERPRTVLLLTHRHSLEALRYALPPELVVVESKRLHLAELPLLPKRWSDRLTSAMGETALGLCDVVVIEHRPTTAAK
jgi:4-amino-4-deoxy-L-arabinose transferase-like glycosyltransferase